MYVNMSGTGLVSRQITLGFTYKTQGIRPYQPSDFEQENFRELLEVTVSPDGTIIFRIIAELYKYIRLTI